LLENSGSLLKKKKITPTFEETMGNISKQRKKIFMKLALLLSWWS